MGPFDDPLYIVNLAKQLFGASSFPRLSVDDAKHPHATYLRFFEKLKDKVRAMNPETLGRICGYGFRKDFSEPIEFQFDSGFIHKTGLREVHPDPFDNQTGRELLEAIAIATIVSVACDIVLQPEYLREQERIIRMHQHARREMEFGLGHWELDSDERCEEARLYLSRPDYD